MGSLWPASKIPFGGLPLKISVLRGVRRSILKFFRKDISGCRFLLYFCNRKRNRKVFERTLTHCKRHPQAESIAQGRIYNIYKLGACV